MSKLSSPTLDPQTEFFNTLLELHYSDDKTKIIESIEQLATKIPYLQGYPKNKTAFWNSESFMWGYKIDTETRAVIKTYLDRTISKTTLPLDLGCGAHSYILSIGFDISPKMLDLNDNAKEKIIGDVEQLLPFLTHSQKAITAIFLLNYIHNIDQCLQEIKRILERDGVFITIFSRDPVNPYYQKHQQQQKSADEWLTLLKKYFKVDVHKEEKIIIYTCSLKFNS